MESIGDNGLNSLTLHCTSMTFFTWGVKAPGLFFFFFWYAFFFRLRVFILAPRIISVVYMTLARNSTPILHRSLRPPRFHYISTCTQFARTDSCLLLWGRRSENIEPAHCAKRQQRRHNSDSSKKKVHDEQSPGSTFYFSSNAAAIKE